MPAEPAIACSGFDTTGVDPCVFWPSLATPVLREGRYVHSFQAIGPHGYVFELEVEMTGDDVGRARFCRIRFDDVRTDDACERADWSCASEGTIELSSPPNGEPGNALGIHAEIHVQFPGGATVDAVY